MLPGPVRNSRYDNNCDGLVTLWQQHSADKDGMDPTLTPRENLARLLYREYRDRSDDDDDRASPAASFSVQMMEEEDKNPHGLAYIDAAGLTGLLLSERSGIPDVLEMIAGVWIEMLWYAARHCTEVSHAKQLSSGGELVTAIGMLVEYTARYDLHPHGHGSEDGHPLSGTSMENGEPSGAAAEVSLDQRTEKGLNSGLNQGKGGGMINTRSIGWAQSKQGRVEPTWAQSLKPKLLRTGAEPRRALLTIPCICRNTSTV